MRSASAGAWMRTTSDGFPAVLICAALLFNWVLSLINAQAISISQAHVAVCEALLMMMAVWHMLRRGLLREQIMILCAFALCIAFMLIRIAIVQDLQLKPLRDIAIIFVFLSLGFSVGRRPYRLVFYMGLFIAAVGLAEVLVPNLYGDLFNVKAYYINSRGFTESQFWNLESTAFVSGTRPGERYFVAFTNWPRASSIFLEPVSLGNFIIVSLMVLLAGWRGLPLWIRAIWAATLVSLLMLADSRFAFFCGIALIASRPLLRWVPQQLSFLLFPAIVAMAVLAVWLSSVNVATDDFLGRLFYTVKAMQRIDLQGLLGMKYAMAQNYMDSGLMYFVISQSVIAAIALPIAYSVGLRAVGTEARLYKHFLMIVLAMNLMISNSLFSIKIAALLWFCVGALGRSAQRATAPAPMLARRAG